MIHTLSIDLETRSGADLRKTGVYKYTEDPDFDILLFGYSADGAPVQVIDLARGEELPEELLRAILSNDTKKWAFNVTFERICLSAWLRKNKPALLASKYPVHHPSLRKETRLRETNDRHKQIRRRIHIL